MPLIAVAPTLDNLNNIKTTAQTGVHISNVVLSSVHKATVPVNKNTAPVVMPPSLKIVRINESPAASVSIGNQSNEENDVSDFDKLEGVGKSDFSQQALLSAWKDYARSIDKEAHTTNAMLNFLPTKGNGADVNIKFVNAVQSEDVLKHKRSIELYLAKRLDNSDIKLNVSVDESIIKDEVFTPEEKFKKIQESNPAFNELRIKLGLELL